MSVHPGATREELISYLVGDVEPPPLDEYTHPVDSWRHGIIGFLLDYWSVLEPQIKCPAKNLRHPTNPDVRPCFGCVDTQVITCVIQNPGRNQSLMEKHRRPKE
jgi:hypothetical protein